MLSLLRTVSPSTKLTWIISMRVDLGLGNVGNVGQGRKSVAKVKMREIKGITVSSFALL